MAKHKNWMWLWWISFAVVALWALNTGISGLINNNVFVTYVLRPLFKTNVLLALNTSYTIIGMAGIIQIYYAFKRAFYH